MFKAGLSSILASGIALACILPLAATPAYRHVERPGDQGDDTPIEGVALPPVDVPPLDIAPPDTAAPIPDNQAPAADVQEPVAPAPRSQEARAMWVVRYSLLSPQQVHAVVERAYRYHFNALMVQVRGRGDAYYHSNIEPRAESLLQQPDDFDPLAQVIREAHGRGIKVFAWVDMMLVWSGKHRPLSAQHVVNAHPNWIDTRADGATMTAGDYEGQFLDPGIPAVRSYTVCVCCDLVRNYNLDGIHMDYIRYPAQSFGFSPDSLTLFYARQHNGATATLAAMRQDAERSSAAFLEWRREQVTCQVREVREGIRSAKPWISLSAAVWANLEDARVNRMQDWPTWLKEGLVDFVCPMAYSTNTDRVVSQIRLAQDLSCGRQVWAGLGAWQMSPAATTAKIEAMRKLGVAGVCLFSYDGLTGGGSSEQYLASLCHGPFQRPAAFPAMPWLASRRPTPATPVASGGPAMRPSHGSL